MESKELFDSKATMWFRGFAAITVVLSHYAEWWAWFVPVNGNAEILRLALAKLGVYGVDIFFLFSGYAMIKSLGQNKMNIHFIWKRIKNVYIPYFIVVGIIELLSGGFTSAQDFFLFASGYDYWYMFVLFMFYIAFIIIWAIINNRHIRTIVFCVFTYLFSLILYNKGMNDFWYLSNIAFAIGILAGQYENGIKRLADKAGIILIALFSIAMIFVIRSGIEVSPTPAQEAEMQLVYKIAATLIWTLLILLLAAKWKWHGKILGILGKNSLYIYLTHTFIFMWVVNYFEYNFAIRFAVSAVLTALASILCGAIINNSMKLIVILKNRQSSDEMIK